LDICTDNLKGFSEQMQDIIPSSVVQKCIVHQIRDSLKYVDERYKKPVVKGLRKVYNSATEERAKTAIRAFYLECEYTYIVRQWEQNWCKLMVFYDFPITMRKKIYSKSSRGISYN
jgi:putative transposase